MFGRNTEVIFQITAWLSFFVLILILLTLITPRLLSWIPLFKNINRKHALWMILIFIILFFISNMAIPEDFP